MKVLKILRKKKQRKKNHKTWRDNYKELTKSDLLFCEKCHWEMGFWFARYGPDNRVLKHFGLDESDRIPIKLGFKMKFCSTEMALYSIVNEILFGLNGALLNSKWRYIRPKWCIIQQ